MSDDEIEYLDEDADIVQQCVQKTTENPTPLPLLEVKTKPVTPLLVERPQAKKKKRLMDKTEEEDSDYDPGDDIEAVSPPPASRSKKKKPNPPRSMPKSSSSLTHPVQKVFIPESLPKKTVLFTVEPKIRRNMKIGIPDYDDPLCMPVRAVIRTNYDKKRLRSWNTACMAHLRHADKLLKPEKGDTKGSTRTVVLRNHRNKETGQYETAVWAKTCVVNENGVMKSQNFQSLLPKFSERTILSFGVVNKKPKKHHHVDEVILTKETYKNEESLVVYKPKDFVSAVYHMTEKSLSPNMRADEDDKRKYLSEVTCSAMCSVCYQMSWRSVGPNGEKKNVRCPVCSRTFVSLYNLLTHVRSHSSEDVRKHKKQLCGLIAKMVPYHYKCRICQAQVPNIAKLKKHVEEHKGTEQFTCEICSHITS